MAELSNRMRKELYKLSTSEDDITLITISHPDWAEPLRYASRALERIISGNTVLPIVTSNEEIYTHAVMSALLPDDEDGDGPTMPIVLDNIGFDAGALIEEDLRDATVDIVVVSKSDPDEILDAAYGFKVVDGDCVNEALTLNVALDPQDPTEPACAYRMTKDVLPGLFL